MTHPRIEIDPDIMGGKPVIRGTRIPVETVLRKLGAGMTADAIITDHPRLMRDDILAAQAFAADYLADEEARLRLTVRWLADECVDAGLVVNLRASGHDVVYMAEIAPAANDAEVVRLARAESRLLLTEDKDFGDLVFRRGAKRRKLCCCGSIRRCMN